MLAKFVDTVCTTIAKVSLYVCGCVSGALNFCAPLIQPHFVFNFNLHRKSTARLGPIFYRYHALRKYVYVSPPPAFYIFLFYIILLSLCCFIHLWIIKSFFTYRAYILLKIKFFTNFKLKTYMGMRELWAGGGGQRKNNISA